MRTACLLALLSTFPCAAQVGSVTRRTIQTPAPGREFFFPSNTTTQATPRVFVQTVRVQAPLDPEKAKQEKEDLVRRTVEFQKKRAEEGSATAQFDLGMRYLTGDGVIQDAAAARKWLELSAGQNHSPAVKKLAELPRQSNPSQ